MLTSFHLDLSYRGSKKLGEHPNILHSRNRRGFSLSSLSQVHILSYLFASSLLVVLVLCMCVCVCVYMSFWPLCILLTAVLFG